MPNYYELLKVEPSATAAEVEAAYEAQYNQWRRLVTHHDPNVVEQANRALRDLEMIRTTLTDAAKRAAYDAGIGSGGVAGGLADPEAVLKRSHLTPPPSIGSVPPIATATHSQPRVDVWICQKCHTPNAVGLPYCSKCGQQIGHNCPNCGKMIAVNSSFCAYCGIDIESFEREQQMKEAARLKQQSEKAQREAEQAIQARANAYHIRRILIGVLCLLLVVLAIIVGLMAVPSMVEAYRHPKWIGDKLEIEAQLVDTKDPNRIQVHILFTNRTTSDYNLDIVPRRDIVVSDNTGRAYEFISYDYASGDRLTEQIHYHEGIGRSFYYVGPIDPQASSLMVKFSKIENNRDVTLSVPLK